MITKADIEAKEAEREAAQDVARDLLREVTALREQYAKEQIDARGIVLGKTVVRVRSNFGRGIERGVVLHVARASWRVNPLTKTNKIAAHGEQMFEPDQCEVIGHIDDKPDDDKADKIARLKAQLAKLEAGQ